VKRIAALVVVLLLGLAAPAPAGAQGSPLGVPPSLTQPDDTTSATPFEKDTGLSTMQLVLMFGGAIAIVAFIAWFIMRDARRVAPAAERGGAGSAAGAAGPRSKSAREREREKARKRNKAKAARNQRKRNRSR
jgi:hypothetical protein